MKVKIIAIANQKGGVAKTTTAINIGVGLVMNNKKVRLVDTDNQRHLSRWLGYSQDGKPTIAELIWQTVSKVNQSISDAIRHSEVEDIDCSPTLDLLVTMFSIRTNSAKAIMDALKESYGDFVFETAISYRDEVKVTSITHKSLVKKKNSVTGQQYMAVVNEIINREENINE